MVSCEKYLKDFILFDINMCSNLMEQILSTTYKIRNELHRLKVSFLSRKIWTMDQNEKNWIKNVDHSPNHGPERKTADRKLRTTVHGPKRKNSDQKMRTTDRTKNFILILNPHFNSS